MGREEKDLHYLLMLILMLFPDIMKKMKLQLSKQQQMIDCVHIFTDTCLHHNLLEQVVSLFPRNLVHMDEMDILLELTGLFIKTL